LKIFRDGTAKGGDEGDNETDFVHSSGILEFKNQESSKTITVAVNKNVKVRFNILCNLFGSTTTRMTSIMFVHT